MEKTINSIAEKDDDYYRIYKLISAFEDIQNDKNERSLKKIRNCIKLYGKETLPLPSGMTGNVLALALEMHYYVAAEHIMLHLDEYGINLEEIARYGKEQKPCSAKNAFKLSLETYVARKTLRLEEQIDSVVDCKTKHILIKNNDAIKNIQFTFENEKEKLFR